MHRLSSVLFAMVSLVLAAACSDSGSAPEGPAVGYTRLAFKDPERRAWNSVGPRPLVTALWYPAAEGAEMTEIAFPSARPVFTGGFAARDAAFRPGKERFPLVVLSHGTGGSALQMMWLGRALAARGFIAAAVDHHGNTAAEENFDPRGFRVPWERARDVSAVIGLLLEDETFGPRIDKDRIGAAGFSLGGYTVTALAGGLTDMERFATFCASPGRDATCDPQPEYPQAAEDFELLRQADPSVAALLAREGENYADARIKRFAALAPALAQAFSDESLSRVSKPFLILAGAGDTIAPVATNAKRLADGIPQARLDTIGGAGHYVFLNECTSHGRRYVPVCKDGEGPSRADIHGWASTAIADFFNAP